MPITHFISRGGDVKSGLKLYWLGTPLVEMDGRAIELETRKATALLAYLSMEKRNFSRESLASLFWPEYNQQKALTNLRRSLWSLNNRLQPNWLEADLETVGLRSGVSVSIDTEAFRQEIAVARAAIDRQTAVTRMVAAAELYRGDFLEGFNLKDCPEFDDWQFFQREGLRQVYAETLEWLSQACAEAGSWEEAAQFARRWVALDRLHEPAQRQLIWLYAQAGQKSTALHQYEAFVKLLQEELGQAPEPATTRLQQQILQGKPTKKDLAAPTQALPVSQPPALEPVQLKTYTNLPYQSTPFIGRIQELDRLSAALADSACRLLTITGPGGMGKSRLAIEAARQQVAHFEHGSCFVPLASLQSTQLLAHTIASSLQISFTKDGSPEEQLLNFLIDKELLLVLDNFEHLLEQAPLLNRVLSQAPRLKILVTSRERLNVSGEWLLSLEGLSYPSRQDDQLLEEYSAIQLFLQTARQAAVGFDLLPEERPALVKICQLVDGTPLGIELAAAWVRMLSLGEIAGELENSLDALVSTRQEMPERHQTLGAVCAHSWNLLPPAEKELFPKLSVFRGSFSRHAAQTIAGASLGMLASLMDRSLLRRTQTGRYSLHEFLRQFGREKLKENPVEEERLLDAHSTYYLRLLSDRKIELLGRRQKEVVAEFVRELDNIHSAWARAVERDRFDLLDGAAICIYFLSIIENRLQEGEDAFGIAVSRLEAILNVEPEPNRERSLILGRLLVYQAALSTMTLHKDVYEKQWAKARQIFESLDEQYEMARAVILTYNGYGRLFLINDPIVLEKTLSETLQVLKDAHDLYGVANCLICLADISYYQGKNDEAKRYTRESMKVSEEMGNPEGVADALYYLGELYHWTGDMDDALKYQRAALEMYQQSGYQMDIERTCNSLGYIERLLGDLDKAEEHHQTALTIDRQLNHQEGMSGSLDNLGLVALDRGDYGSAVHYAEEALAIRRRLGIAGLISVSTERVGNAYRMLGQYDLAQKFLEESLALAWRSSFLYEIAQTSVVLAMVHAQLGKYPLAAREYADGLENALWIGHFLAFSHLIGLAELRFKLGEPEIAAQWLQVALRQSALVPADRRFGEQILEQLKSALASEVFENAANQSKALSEEDALAEALTWAKTISG
jgi:predicted ATPase/DNA-binding SARP family transcriptional activator